MKLRCKPGDIALIIADEPGCEANIGRLVHVRGPLAPDFRTLLPTWLIKPVHKGPWMVGDYKGSAKPQNVFWKSRIQHPDNWMVPLRPPESDDSVSEQESSPVEHDEVCHDTCTQ